MADFCSALYLGMRHPARSLAGWTQLTRGKPAALEEAPGAAELARELADLQRCEAAVLMPSTLHLYWDLFGLLAEQSAGGDAAGLVLLVDGAAYPVARWGAQRAVAHGLPLQVFRHGDAAAAERLARCWRLRGRRPVILADGYSPGMPVPPPLAAYGRIAARHEGYLVLDDTQVLGLSGAAGGGSVSAHGIAGPHVLAGASLAKGFGVPLAVLAGSAAMVRAFEAASQTRRHCSPPSVAVIEAGRHAIRVNRARGDRLRGLLARRVAQLRDGLAALGVRCHGGGFPVQVVPISARDALMRVHAALACADVHVVPQWGERGGALSFLLRADHSVQEVSHALSALRSLNLT